MGGGVHCSGVLRCVVVVCCSVYGGECWVGGRQSNKAVFPCNNHAFPPHVALVDIPPLSCIGTGQTRNPCDHEVGPLHTWYVLIMHVDHA